MHSYLIVLIISLTTMIIRFLPFVVFKKKVPDFIAYLGKMLPMCAMAMLVVYCLRDIGFKQAKDYLPSLISSLMVVVIYKWKHSTALAIITGTALYMLMIRYFFV